MLIVTPPFPAAVPGGTRSGSHRLHHPAATPDPAEQAPNLSLASPTSLCLSRPCGREPLTHRFDARGAGVHSCCACCTRPPAPHGRASRSPSPWCRARGLAAAPRTSGRLGTRDFQRFGLPCFAPARKPNANSAAGWLGCDTALFSARPRSEENARRLCAAAAWGGFWQAGSRRGGCWQERGDASLLLPGGDARRRRRSRSSCASHPAAIAPVARRAELSRH